MRTRALVGLVASALAGASACGADLGVVDVEPPPGEPAASDGGARRDAGSPVGAADRVPPSAVGDLTVVAASHTALRLRWTAPGDDGSSGRAASYEIRYATTPIASDAELALAKVALPVPAPLEASSVQTALIEGLLPSTTYHVAMRARDEAGNVGPLSRPTSGTTRSRASFLVAEIAPSNTAAEGFDFVELVAARGGWAEGIAVRQASGPLHTLGAIEVATGDRVVVHATGIPGPGGFAQEDADGNKAASTAAFASADAYDLYATVTGLTGTDNLISVVDGVEIQDAVALSNRDGDAATATMTAFAAAEAAGHWSFAEAPAEGANDCATQRDAVAVSTGDSPCGGFDTGLSKGASVNRLGTTDTNRKQDFYVATQTPGAANAPPSAPSALSAVATGALAVELRFDQELAPATVQPGAFVVTGAAALGVDAASAVGNVVSLTTTSQVEGGAYLVTFGAGVTSAAGVPLATPTARFCGFSPDPARLALLEVHPDIAGGADLVELAVTRGGALSGYQLRLSPSGASAGTLLAAMPGICAVTGDLVVVHLVPGAAVGVAPASETWEKDELGAATYVANADGAWDVLGGALGIPATSAVLAVRSAGGAWLDAAAFTNASGGATSAAFKESLTFVQSLGLWTPADCGGAPCSDASTPTAQGVSAVWSGVGTAPASPSVRRLAPATAASSWSVGASSLGAPN